MTLTIELAPEVERVLERKARARGVKVEQYLVEMALEMAEGDAREQDEKIAARLAALDELNALARSMPNNRAGLPELDLSGSRADVYSYSKREESQL